MNKKNYSKEFMRFLKVNDAYSNYIREFGKQNEIKDIQTFIQGIAPTLYIFSAFIWAETQTGEDYWCFLDRKWRQKIRV